MEPSRNFDLRLSGTLSAVSVEVDSPAGQTAAPAVLPCNVSPQALEDLRDAVPGVDLKVIGSALWRCAFGASAVAELWRASRAEVGSNGILRLRLTIDAAELAALPWELLYDETLGRFLALDGQTPVTRFTRLPIPSAPWPQDRPLRLLFTGASPSDMFTLSVAQEWEGIEQMIAPLVKQGSLETPDPLPEGATLPALLAALRRKVDIWHFAGHGTDNGLIFCKDNNRPNPVDAAELGQMLLGEGVRLAVINACRAGAGGGQAASVAGALLRANIPSVIAMQSNVSDVAADAFAGAFYDAIAAGQDVDQAVTAARKEMWAVGTREWWTPALFMRTPEGRIWRKPIKGVASETRARELAYLDGVIEKYKYWAEKYTPLAGVAEVWVAEADSQQLDLPDPFIPTGFEKLVEHGYGMERRTERVPVDDLREAVANYRRLVILGEPGSGKTTTLWRLAYDLAVAARQDPQAPVPLLVPLEAYSGPESALAYAQGYFEELSPHLPAYLRSKRVILLLDALNQMPQADREERVRRIQTLLDQHPDVSVVVTCRAIDYVETLGLEKLEVKPLEPGQQRDYLQRYLGETAGDKLFWQLCSKRIADVWQTWQQAGGTWEQFWTATDIPMSVRSSLHDKCVELWRAMRKNDLPPLLALGRNPYMLVMLAQVFRANKGVLPQNRGRLFGAFADTLLGREENRCDPALWPGADPLRLGMTQVAYAMQTAGTRGTTVDAGWAAKQMAQRGVDGDKAAYLCASATLLEISESRVRFVHQMVQEYFAALALIKRLEQGAPLLPEDDYVRPRWWPADRKVTRGWEETLVLVAGILEDLQPIVNWLLQVDPVLAARCIAESGSDKPTGSVLDAVQQRLLGLMQNPNVTLTERDAAGVALNLVGDPRLGVGLRSDGLPDIEWVFVPDIDPICGRREYFYGESKERRTETDFWMARYPVTYLQFQAFLDATDGYRNLQWWEGLVQPKKKKVIHRGSWVRRRFRTMMSEQVKSMEMKSMEDGILLPKQQFEYWNHPRDTVSWHDSIAFCRWLTDKAQAYPDLLPRDLDLSKSWRITLPTEWQWEKAARGYDGRLFPWGGDEFERGYANVDSFGLQLNKTTAVGMYPKGASPYGIMDLSGNVREWCLNHYYRPDETEITPPALRVLRGGSWDNPWDCATTSSRYFYDSQDYAVAGYGFRVVIVGSVLSF